MASKPKRAALYLQVSTDGQTVDNQRLALDAVCEQRGWQMVEVYSDNGVSGAKRRNQQRPGLDALLKDAHSEGVRRGDGLEHLIGSAARFLDPLDTLGELEAAGVALVLHQQALDTTTPAGRMFFQVTGAFAEFERAMIRSRVRAGLDRARARGVRLGRPKTSAKVEAVIRAPALVAGEGVKKVAKAVGVGNGTVSRIAPHRSRRQHPADCAARGCGRWPGQGPRIDPPPTNVSAETPSKRRTSRTSPLIASPAQLTPKQTSQISSSLLM